MGGIITELKLVLSEFAVSHVQVCPRTCNRVADALASYMVVIIQSDEQITWQFVPTLLRNW
jgi:hypothetical protein